MKTYEEQLQEQIERYRNVENMHDLPGIFHIWSSEHVVPPMQQVFGVGDMNSFYVEAFVAATRHRTGALNFLSLGCGDGAVEIGIAQSLMQRGITDFNFVGYDLSHVLLDRFRASLPTGLASHFELVTGDLNGQLFNTSFDVVMANHSLHHMVDLEGIFRTAYDNLTAEGVFVTSDMIGRNGHMHWPEARFFVDFVWPILSPRQRANILLRRVEWQFMDHDCSTEGFEGVRAQDVLPVLLAQGFTAWKFLSFEGMIDVFIDRCFGPNFNADSADDVFLIRRLGLLNDILLDAGLIKPTMMLGSVRIS